MGSYAEPRPRLLTGPHGSSPTNFGCFPLPTVLAPLTSILDLPDGTILLQASFMQVAVLSVCVCVCVREREH